MEILLRPYTTNHRTAAGALIREFWLCHNGWEQTGEETSADLTAWTGEGHRLYLIELAGEAVGFVHLGSRGGEPDWLEDIFVRPDHQGKGVGSAAIALAEEVVREYSDCLYMEVAARNSGALRLYHRLGYDALNTVTIRKDFAPRDQETLRTESIHGMSFEIRRRKG